ncbi:MAG: RecQ family ATP-dependent DNA helicase [Parachlamydiaceae bacterium]
MESLQNALHTTLQKTFGLPHFRKGQLEAITTLMTEGRALCILPTGYGKSLLYQLPACLLGGITLVISPLLALMRDQIDHLNRRFNIAAMAINSDQTDEENSRARQAAYEGRIKILFIAPEQLDHIDRFQFLLNLNVQLVVVDEAHCISTWGHDFRPSYRQILNFLHAIHAKNNQIRILGLTATANKRVEADIHKQLFFAGQKGIVLRQAMDRPNIQLSVVHTRGIVAKLAACEKVLRHLNGCGLIYCATRENTEIVADYLREQGLNVASYHAGYEFEEKKRLQQEFIQDKYKALVATNALGMGIDKGNLSFIIHFDFPGSITAYYQEVGRCGRDGQPANGVMLYDPADCVIHNYFIHSAIPSIDDFHQILNAVTNAATPPGLLTLKTLTGLHPTRVTIVIAELVEQGFLEKYSNNGKQVYRILPKWGTPDLSRYKTQQTVKTQELRQITNYGEQSNQCRMTILRHALGDDHNQECRTCDCCIKKSPASPLPHGASSLQFATEFAEPSAPQAASISAWINKRPVPITPTVKEKISEGLSVLDSKIRSPLFIRFMKERACCEEGSLGMDHELIELIKHHLTRLASKDRIKGIILLPSRTWLARNRFAQLISSFIHAPVLEGLLEWNEIPPKRQGELLNNDQRRDNVYSRMRANIFQLPPAGTLLLLDDYIGSGNTIKEAARALRSRNIDNKLVPFTVAAVKWHLGKPGF